MAQSKSQSDKFTGPARTDETDDSPAVLAERLDRQPKDGSMPQKSGTRGG